jgi:hypothetical protein
MNSTVLHEASASMLRNNVGRERGDKGQGCFRGAVIQALQQVNACHRNKQTYARSSGRDQHKPQGGIHE